MKELEDITNPRYWHELYIELLANPMDRRTDKEFCAEMNLHVSSLTQWKSKYRKSIFNEVQKRRAAYINEMRASAYKALASKMDKDTNALKLALQITGDLVERHETKVEMSTDEKLRRIRSLRDGLKGREKAWTSAEAGQDGSSVPGPES